MSIDVDSMIVRCYTFEVAKGVLDLLDFQGTEPIDVLRLVGKLGTVPSTREIDRKRKISKASS
jgi:hypothetical protein